MNENQRPPKGSISRGTVIGTVTAKAAGKSLVSATRGLFLNEKDREQLRIKTRQEIAEIVFAGLSQLRGTALKMAQLFCGESGLLPPEYLAVFEQSHYRVPPLSPPIVRRMLRQELGHEPEELFAQFELRAFAAASLGQVHRAQLKSGEEVAVKIQYPGMKEAMLTDFGLARKVLLPLYQKGLMLATLDELEERLKREIDYQKEAQTMALFAERLSPLGVSVPKVFFDLTSSRVLTQQFCEGLHLDEWAKLNPPRKQVNSVAQQIFTVFLKSVFDWRSLHADPNFGNFLIDQSGRLTILDFGAIKELTSDGVQFYSELWNFTKDVDGKKILLAYEKRGAQIQDESQFLEKVVLPYTNWIQKVIRSDKFEFSTDSSFVREGHEIFSRQIFNPDLENFSANMALLHRTLLGVLTLFSRLGAEIDVKSLRALYQ